jgi:hypothetical protein
MNILQGCGEWLGGDAPRAARRRPKLPPESSYEAAKSAVASRNENFSNGKLDRPAINGRRSSTLRTDVRPRVHRTKANRPRATRVEFGQHPNLRRRETAAAVVLQPLQGVARGLMPIDWAAIWYQLVDLKTATRRAVLRLRLAFALTCDPWRTDPWRTE